MVDLYCLGLLIYSLTCFLCSWSNQLMVVELDKPCKPVSNVWKYLWCPVWFEMEVPWSSDWLYSCFKYHISQLFVELSFWSFAPLVAGEWCRATWPFIAALCGGGGLHSASSVHHRLAYVALVYCCVGRWLCLPRLSMVKYAYSSCVLLWRMTCLPRFTNQVLTYNWLDITIKPCFCCCPKRILLLKHQFCLVCLSCLSGLGWGPVFLF